MDKLDAVSRLILLNGPPGIGKSTLAQRYVDDHPGVLNLDVDRVRMFVGGWQERFAETGGIIRPVALSMAAAHLQGGRDVIMPQYLGDRNEIERFERVAHDNAAGFREIAILDTKGSSLARFGRRGDGDDLPWHDQVQQIVEDNGGATMLALMYDELTGVLSTRPGTTVIHSVEGAIEDTYLAILAALKT